MMPRFLFTLFAAWLAACPASAQERLVIAFPGPLNIPLLPLELASRIGADKAEGLELVPHYASGALSLQHLQNRNVDFAVPGAPAAMSAKAAGNDIVFVVPINDLPVYVLVARNELKNQVKRPRDLAGRVVGVTTSSLAVRTTSHQVAELVLKNDGVPVSQIRIVAAGQGWEDMQAAIRGGTIDALLSFEPYPSRLQDAGLAYPVFNLADPADSKRIAGAGFLLAAVVTRSDVIANSPQKVERLVAVIRRTLEWIASHTPEQIVDALRVADAETRASLLRSLRQYPRLYSPDGKFSARQIRETELFFAATDKRSRSISLAEITDARWAGKKP